MIASGSVPRIVAPESVPGRKPCGIVASWPRRTRSAAGPAPFHGCGRATGLTNLADRVAAVGGTLDIDARLGRGTRVIGELPASG
jgi:hypothetical protein